MISGLPYSLIAPTAFTIRSAPNSLGFGYFIFKYLSIGYSPTIIGSTAKYFFAIISKAYMRGGTTEEIIISLTTSNFMPRFLSNELIKMTYSFSVFSRSVFIRYLYINLSSSNILNIDLVYLL